MRMYMKSIAVNDQSKALDFYTGKLGFVVKHDIPLGEYRWLTVVSNEDPDRRGMPDARSAPNPIPRHEPEHAAWQQ